MHLHGQRLPHRQLERHLRERHRLTAALNVGGRRTPKRRPPFLAPGNNPRHAHCSGEFIMKPFRIRTDVASTAALILCFGALAACDPEPPCWKDVQTGTTYRVSLASKASPA